MSARRAQGGFLSIVVLLVVVVLAALAIAMGFLVGNSSLSSAVHTGSMQAFFLAESGLESEHNRWAQNLNWYRSTIDPSPTAPPAQALGTGTYVASTTLPATMLKTQLTMAGGTINAYTTSRFPASGILQVDDDLGSSGELVRYTGIGGASFTGVTRAQTVGSVTSVASAHDRSSVVYPVTILRTTMPANCAAMASIQVDANTKFITAGTLDIEGEEVGYSGSSTTGGTTTLTGIGRCLGLTINVGHAIGQPVTPVLQGDDSADYQVEISSTGTVGTNVRYARRTIQR
jgi:Tfp pilus assembly protein PilX